MQPANDQFSAQAKAYHDFRPRYPEAIYRFLRSQLPAFDCAWDAACGNGQVAIELAHFFQEVHASDISKAQLDLAEKKANIRYHLQRAEANDFRDQQFDLITLAQAAHWIDWEVFLPEVKRLLKPQGLIAIWAYGLIRSTKEMNLIIDHFYQEVIAEYWSPERKHIDRHYQDIPFDLPIVKNHAFEMQVHWSLDALIGYLQSWSAVQNYKDKMQRDPLPDFVKKVQPMWGKGERKTFNFPIFMLTGKLNEWKSQTI